MFKQAIASVAVGAVLACGTSAWAQALPAFPGADGAARNVTGGRGGLVYHVTKVDLNYDHNEPGTLRYGLNDANFSGQPRTIVFDVAGTFWLGRYGAERGHYNGWDTQSRLNLGSHITIAGQTAPGPVYVMGGLVKAGGDNVILRNVTIAPGYGMRNFEKPDESPPELPTPGDFPDSYVYDAIDITGTNQMIDHVTTVYATDETISANEAAANITIQYSNISQGQNYPQADAEASGVRYTGHALGSLLQAGSNAKISVHHSLYAHQKGRLPRVGSEEGTGAYNDFRNNVFYNWLGTAGGGASGQPSFNNFVGNVWLAGPGGEDPVGGTSTAITNRAGGTGIFNGSNSSGTRVYHAGNAKDLNKNGTPQFTTGLTNSDFGSSSIQPNSVWAGGQPTYTGVTDSAAAAFDRVLRYMGAHWWSRDYDYTLGNVDAIDTVDERLIHETATGTGKIKAWADDPFNNDPQEGVEWRQMLSFRADPATGAAPFNRPADWDVDGDGMPGFWEAAHGLDPSTADNNGDFDSDGYTNLEEYINELAAWPAPQSIVFHGAGGNRYAAIGNWDIAWQPSRYDAAVVKSGTVVVDAVGQHAGALLIAPAVGDAATLNVQSGWIDVADVLEVGAAGAGVVDHTGGIVLADEVVLGGGPGASGAYNLSGNGRLRAGVLSQGADGGAFNFTGGELAADVIIFNLVNQGGVIAPGNGVGQTEVIGDLAIEQGSVRLDLGGVAPGSFDRIVIGGDLEAGGVLEVNLLSGFAPQLGDSFDLLDFTAANGSFTLALPALVDGLAWDASNLLSTGALAVVDAAAQPADFNGDGLIDGTDLALWQAGFGSNGHTNNSLGDADGSGTVDGADFLAWQRQFVDSAAAQVAVPEPSAPLLMVLAIVAAVKSLRIRVGDAVGSS